MKVAYYYEKGIGIKKDLIKAAELYQIMANSGEAEAQYRLAQLYLVGQGINKQPKNAFSLMQKAAQKIPQAKNQLGLFYLYGIGTEKKPQKASELFLSAAYRQESDAQNNLAVLYATGQGIRKNIFRAIMWFATAAKLNNATAKENLKQLQTSSVMKSTDLKLSEKYD